jgi:hypothetical protein
MKKANRHPGSKLSKLVLTTDEWSPNYTWSLAPVSRDRPQSEQYVIASVMNLYRLGRKTTDPCIVDMCRVCVWGADDTGMEMDLSISEWDTALAIYRTLPEPITMQWLRNQGFINA